MSVEYELVCHRHKERFWVCSDGVSGPVNQLDNNKKLAAFIITHRKCDLHVIDEFNEVCDDYRQADDVEWDKLLVY